MRASQIMSGLNRNAVQSTENGKAVFLEDVQDPDGRWYRIEYECDPSGSHANAFVRHNPWGGNPHSYHESHMDDNDGFLCLGPHSSKVSSPYDLPYAVKRARLWCAGFSHMREKGYEATCRVLPEWRG